MRNKKLLLGIWIAALVCIFMIPGSAYSAKEQDSATTQSGIQSVDQEFPEKPEDKGSPLHLWMALVDKGLKAGSTITTAEIKAMRNWSDSTINDEINSLIDIGVLRRDSRGNFTVLVTATNAQVNQIHEMVKPIVDKKGAKGETLGLDSYKVDMGYLGTEKVSGIRNAVAQVTGKVNPLDSIPQEKVFTTTANAILTDPNETIAITSAIGNGYTIAIATQDNSEEYVSRVIGRFSNPDMIKNLVNNQIVFSLVRDGNVLAAIEALVAKTAAERTLNNLDQAQITALKSGV